MTWTKTYLINRRKARLILVCTSLLATTLKQIKHDSVMTSSSEQKIKHHFKLINYLNHFFPNENTTSSLFFFFGINTINHHLKKKKFPEKKYFSTYVWNNSQIPLLFLKLINFFIYIWKKSKYPEFNTFSIKSNNHNDYKCNKKKMQSPLFLFFVV